MECFVPGRLLVAPEMHFIEEYESEISERIGLPLRFDHSVEDILSRYELPTKIDTLRDKFGPLPRVALVPEGEERAAAERVVGTGRIAAACPDFVVRPLSGLSLDHQVIHSAITFVGARPSAPFYGENCTVAILDTGIDSTFLDIPGVLHPVQYDVENPLDRGSLPTDASGHGSLVAHIINRIAPAAQIISIKTMTSTGTVSGVLTGLYLSNALGPADLVNLSLSVSCDPDPCRVCRTPPSASTSTAQLNYFFQSFLNGDRTCAILAAAGNGYSNVAMPAVFSDILAVGDFDFPSSAPSANSAYRQVPPDRYVMAPGGRRSKGEAFGERPSHRAPLLFSGTSFSTAFATGVAARHVCAFKDGTCSSGTASPPTSLFEHIKTVFKQSADQNWPTYDPQKHGLGALRFAPAYL
ncbi:MAG: S8/S53 family peptidase [Hyphomicrobium sp.]